jgi:hypothetical protein
MYKARLVKPEKGNKYYITRANGGFSPCIKGQPLDPELDVLANCVGYAAGRFNEIGGAGWKYLGSTNAENFVDMAKTQGLTVQQEPTIGGCMVWAKGEVGNGADGAGHVAICEQINADGSIITSESGYGYKAFYTTNRTAPNWERAAGYNYLGCIVNPAVDGAPPVPAGVIKKGDQGDAVRWLQTELTVFGYLPRGWIDGDFGRFTLGALLAFQLEHDLEPDGICGPKTKAALML